MGSDVRVRDVVRDIVGTLAEGELVLVDALDRFDDSEVTRIFRRRRDNVEPLGYGWGQVSVLFTPVIWLALSDAARQFGVRAGDGAATGLRSLLRRLFRKQAEPQVLMPPFSREQLDLVHSSAVRIGKERKMSDAKSKQIADAIVTALATSYQG